MQPNVCNTVGHTGSYAWGEHVSREAQRSSNQESLGVSHGECHGKKNGFTLWDDELEREFYTAEEIAASNARIRKIVKDRVRGWSIKMKARYKNCELNATREQSLGGEIFIYYSAYDLANGF